MPKVIYSRHLMYAVVCKVANGTSPLDLEEATGIPASTIRDWCSRSYVIKTFGGRGRKVTWMKRRRRK